MNHMLGLLGKFRDWFLGGYHHLLVDRFLPTWRVAFACRVSFIAVILCSVLLYAVQAGEEALRAAAEKNDYLLFLIPPVLLGFCAWLSSRLMVDHQFDFETGKSKTESTKGRHFSLRPAAPKWAITWLPRVFGLLPISVATLGLAYSLSQDTSPQLQLSLGASMVALLLLFSIFYFRRCLTQKIKTKIQNMNPKFAQKAGDFGESLAGLIAIYIVVGFTLAGLCAINLWRPTWIGSSFGSIGATMFAASFFVFGIGYLIYLVELYYTRKVDEPTKRRFPILSAVAVLCAALSMFGDPYAIRTIGALPEKSIKTMAEAVNDFENNSGCKGPMVVVATSGGASRAAYWTATVLSKLHASSDHFRKCFFAISSVSGGSVGATEFVAAINNDPIFDSNGSNYVLEAAGSDYLGSTLGGLFVNDGIFAFLHYWNLPSRASSLEISIENAWGKFAPDPNKGLISGDFLNLWKKDHAWPILLINGTHAQSGRRIITSNINTNGLFVDSYDFFDVTKKSISASTAMHNSARFSYVSPAGHLPPGGIKNADQGYIIDGGYYENFGAETALELVQAVHRLKPSQTFEIIQISSDPDLVKLLADPNSIDCRKSPKTPTIDNNNFWNFLSWQYLMPLDGLLQARNARGIAATQHLACASQDREQNQDHEDGVVFYKHLAMTMPKDQSEPPLSWVLSNETKKNIKGLIEAGGTQFDAFNLILKQFSEVKAAQ
jgi:hypothetical protein